MPISMLIETRNAIGADAGKCDSRSLFLDRFADPLAKDTKDSTPRKEWFGKLVGRKSAGATADTDWIPSPASKLHARLMGRLMVNMSGGVMEHANLLIDRYGLPTIPGSAVKGCARRMALQALHDWVGAGTARPAEDDACAPSCEGFASPAEMLAAIARVFGWVEKDWESGQKDGLYLSDLGWACGDQHAQIWKAAAVLLAQRLGWKEPSGETPWKALPSFTGTIAFLAASPNRDPGLELDVLTPHHKEYYEGKLRVATDTEDPVPVFFPAIKPQKEGDYFTFPLIPMRRAIESDLVYARRWLAAGLETFGVGAKTNAGYGWFDASEELNSTVLRSIEDQKDLLRAENDRKVREALDAAEQEVRRAAKEALRRELDGLTPDQQEDKKIEILNDSQFDIKVAAFCKEPKKGGPTEEEKKAIVRTLRGVRLAYWQTFKTKATKGPLATVDQAIRALNKQLHGDKMP